MKIFKGIAVFTVVVLVLTLLSFSQKKEEKRKEVSVQTNSETKVAYFASGCFWCVEAIFESVSGVEEAVSGYAGGHTTNPTYKTIGTGRTGHAESVAVYYNPKKVSFQTLVTVFFGSHDPTTKNGQHPDYGSQYRSIAFYKTQEEKQLIQNTIRRLNKEVYQGKIVTEVKKMEKFYPAEEYHQNYERLHPENPYVQKVSIPRLNRFKRKFPELLKKEKH
ncbi:peptide-methionine (S)-S-oxide reductase MsrA [Tenacibaculum sp. FZY0031]|uniref:peptide-methionine (S)-S-oxide reductase MsrA n=1 Tax=Tenacibaculum sp. FZY0031 TaxID=3116648 RepID=UPI002EAF42E6|nr:peptide-methionine (S)-S-oxide reductase MsrA [Tenacibaculum sp. FZY0031]